METNRNILTFYLIFIVNLLVTIVKSNEDLIKNSKVLTCVSLARGAIKNERNSIDAIASGFKSTDKGEVSSKILTLLIVKCFRNISGEQSIDILTQLHNKETKEFAWKSEYRDIMGLNSDITEDINSESFLEDFKEVNRILKELNDEAQSIKDSMESKNKNPQSSPKNTQKKTQTENKKNQKETNGNSIFSFILNPFLVIFNSIISLVGFDSFFGVGIMIFLVFLLSYALRMLFTGGAKPLEKKKKVKDIKKEN